MRFYEGRGKTITRLSRSDVLRHTMKQSGRNKFDARLMPKYNGYTFTVHCNAFAGLFTIKSLQIDSIRAHACTLTAFCRDIKTPTGQKSEEHRSNHKLVNVTLSTLESKKRHRGSPSYSEHEWPKQDQLTAESTSQSSAYQTLPNKEPFPQLTNNAKS